jgi:hypothetical protein
VSLERVLQVLDGLLPALDGGLVEAHLDGRLSTGEVPRTSGPCVSVLGDGLGRGLA